jgi:hypothetical protein
MYRAKDERNILHTIKRRKITELVTFFVGTTFPDTLLGERYRDE